MEERTRFSLGRYRPASVDSRIPGGAVRGLGSHGRDRLAPWRVRILICAALLYLSFVFSFSPSAWKKSRPWEAVREQRQGSGLRTGPLHSRPASPDPSGAGSRDPERDIRRVLATAAVVAFSLWGMDIAGYYLSSGIMLLVLCLLLERGVLPCFSL